jgi:hypothetical protein
VLDPGEVHGIIGKIDKSILANYACALVDSFPSEIEGV